MVGFPFSGDQMYNGKRMEHHGFGIALNIQTITPDILLTTINEIMNNPSYKQKIQQASQIMRDTDMFPAEKGALLIEHVMKHGGDHLRPRSQDMPAYELLMLDILAFVIGCSVLIIAIVVFIIKSLFKCCKGNGKEKLA